MIPLLLLAYSHASSFFVVVFCEIIKEKDESEIHIMSHNVLVTVLTSCPEGIFS